MSRIPNKLEVGQIWETVPHHTYEKIIVTQKDVDNGYFVCRDGIMWDANDELGSNGSTWCFAGYENNKNTDMEKIKVADGKNVPLTRKDKVQLLNGQIACIGLSQLVEMTDAEVDAEFEKTQTVTNSQFEGFKAVARVLVNNGYWQDGIDFNYIESVLKFRGDK